MKRAMLVSVLGVGALLSSGCAGSSLQEDATVEVEVVSVVDGDTIRVEHGGEEHDVRLLNVDTPETKDPDEEVQCLGPEATEFLSELLAPGDAVNLEFDEERQDRYDRLLAGVFKDGELVNAAIARAGFGIAAYFEPNDKFLAPVQEAQGEAEAAGRGLFDDSVACTVPGIVEETLDAVEQLPAEQPDQYEALEESAAAAAAALLVAGESRDLVAALDVDGSDFHHRVYAPHRDTYERQLDDAIATTEKRISEAEAGIQQIDDERAAEREEVERQAAAEREAERQAAEDRAAEERERERSQRSAPAPAPQPEPAPAPERQPAPQPQPAPDPAPAPAPAPAPERDSGGGSGGGSPNLGPSDRPAGYTHREEPTSYTGPRCFLPGGNWWKPC